jgi:hypothetical protein
VDQRPVNIPFQANQACWTLTRGLWFLHPWQDEGRKIGALSGRFMGHGSTALPSA